MTEEQKNIKRVVPREYYKKCQKIKWRKLIIWRNGKSESREIIREKHKKIQRKENKLTKSNKQYDATISWRLGCSADKLVWREVVKKTVPKDRAKAYNQSIFKEKNYKEKMQKWNIRDSLIKNNYVPPDIRKRHLYSKVLTKQLQVDAFQKNQKRYKSFINVFSQSASTLCENTECCTWLRRFYQLD